MIDVNLLATRERPTDRVQVVPIAAIALIVGALCVAVALLRSEMRVSERLRDRLAEAVRAVRAAEVEVAAVGRLKREVREAQRRLAAVEELAGSRLSWSLKLDQLIALMPASIWLDRLSFKQRDSGAGELRLALNARGSSFEKLTDFKRRLREDTNFFHHFEAVLTPDVRVITTPADVLDPSYMTLSMTLPLRSRAVTLAQRG